MITFFLYIRKSKIYTTMKTSLFAIITMFFFGFFIVSCDESTSNGSTDNLSMEEDLEDYEEEMDESEEEEEIDDGRDVISYDAYNYTTKFTEDTLEKGPSHILDFRDDRDGDQFIKVNFADGYSGTLVLRNGRFYNYTIKSKTEVRFATKEDGLQSIWDNSRLLQDAGAAIATMISKEKGPLKKDGTPDMRYKVNKK